jgi:hypothetical protein
MREATDVAAGDPVESPRAELLMEAIADIRVRAKRYVQEPGDAAWHDLVSALARTHGDSEAYDLLRAVEIHLRTSTTR